MESHIRRFLFQRGLFQVSCHCTPVRSEPWLRWMCQHRHSDPRRPGRDREGARESLREGPKVRAAAEHLPVFFESASQEATNWESWGIGTTAECSQQVLVGVLTPGLWDRAGLLCKSVAAASSCHTVDPGNGDRQQAHPESAKVTVREHAQPTAVRPSPGFFAFTCRSRGSCRLSNRADSADSSGRDAQASSRYGTNGRAGILAPGKKQQSGRPV
mmetsp:Transcript_18672/g.44263  ORF Transcript_18672/g.44263 Transcript_18672/m.44263 type:complete len:215 (+) Transcript_18672:697-1341(+)